jgi:hypothetical protein
MKTRIIYHALSDMMCTALYGYGAYIACVYCDKILQSRTTEQHTLENEMASTSYLRPLEEKTARWF